VGAQGEAGEALTSERLALPEGLGWLPGSTCPPPEGSRVELLPVNSSWPEDFAASWHADGFLPGGSLE